ncbi:MAG: cobaltochelatase subunit CobN [Tannerellaceae bacterium]|jgi:cobaltochelatase CobN|nr:cobaltochelatase subunit CobN [Tannerellaceae bacterium]
MRIKQKNIILATVAVAVMGLAWAAWKHFASVTNIALINFQPFQTASIVKANTDKFIKYEDVPLESLNRLKRFDFVLGFGMGMQITAEQRAQIQSAADNGIPLYIHGATNPDNNINNLDSLQRKSIAAYVNNGNRKNYQSLARYIRQAIDAKTFFVNAPDSVQTGETDVLYHLDPDIYFKEVSTYEEYLKSNNFYTTNAPRIAIIGGLNDPFGGNRDNLDSLIVSLQCAGMNVYPVSSFMKRMSFLREIAPDAVIYFAHGRMAMGQNDAAVDWLKERNIPVFAPISLLQTKEEWEADPMGMYGGFFSQSIVMPELDGTIYPYVLNAQEIDDDGLYLFKAIPERLNNFTQIVANFISLKRKSNADKKLAVYYFKGAGQSSLTAQGLETVPALHNFLKRLKAEGYNVNNLPDNVKDFEKILMTQGAVLSTYAEGSFDDFLKNGQPALVEKNEYEKWASLSLPASLYADVVNTCGEAPGEYMSVKKDDQFCLAVARIQFGNIALLPQPMAGLGGDAFAIVHGAKAAPPHPYIASYLWAHHAFKADAMLHFGTHGSLEFTPQKQVALSDYDWPDRLVGTIPHFYYYTIGNIGESMMAKRRSYATTVSYLTPAFMETDMRGQFKTLQDKIRRYYKTEGNEQLHAALEVKRITIQMGIHRDLRLDSIRTEPYNAEEIERIENFAEEIANEKMNGHLYTSGISYSDEKIRSTVMAMSADPIAYSLANLDKLRGSVDGKQLANKSFFTDKYLIPAKALVTRILNGTTVTDELLCSLAGITTKDLEEAKTILAPPRRMMPANMMPSASPKTQGGKQSSSGGGHPAWIPKIGHHHEQPKNSGAQPDKPTLTEKAKTEYTPEQKNRARAITEIERTIRNITINEKALRESPEIEFKSLLNALAGGYISPSSGGDAVANPAAVPTGRNLYSINAEATPSEVAWDKGVALVNATLESYKKQHGDYPRKVSYTFWSSEFIESEGATIAQVLYMLGVEPVRDAYGRVSDLQLINIKDLGRPRIDVVVQTSGQFRDLAASRLALISRAVEMAASAKDEGDDNHVSASAIEMERSLVEQGISPKDAREMSVQRIFGGINGMYGTGIQAMVTSGDRWEDEKEIANVYINNMGAIYGSEKTWGQFHDGLLRTALHNTDVVVQPRQSNTWGALSLDHVYEFMGGLNLAVRNVTGKDPDAYFADYRNRNNVRMQELKEAIGVEARSTVFNPAYIKEVMKGNASSAAQITEVVTNTYGWNVMKPSAIDKEMWDKMYNIYVKDEYQLGTESFFRRENPHALQEITAVMLETVRKGMWPASEQQIADIADLHASLVKEFGSTASGFAAGNAKLQDFISQKLNPSSASDYRNSLEKMKKPDASTGDNSNGVVLKKNEISSNENGETNSLNGLMIAVAVLAAFIVLLIVLKRKRAGKE